METFDVDADGLALWDGCKREVGEEVHEPA